VNASTWRGRTTRKCRWSRVAVSSMLSRSARAITDASVVPSGRSSYRWTSSHPGHVLGRQTDHLETPSCNRFKEGDLRERSDLCLQEIATLSQDGLWHQKSTVCEPKAGEQLDAGMMVGVLRSAAAKMGPESQRITNVERRIPRRESHRLAVRCRFDRPWTLRSRRTEAAIHHPA